MTDEPPGERLVLVDASAFITLAAVDLIDALLALDGAIVVPTPVANEITSEPASSRFADAAGRERLRTMDVGSSVADAAAHLGRSSPSGEDAGDLGRPIEGDTALLALALDHRNGETATGRCVVVSDDKPLRQTCRALSIPVSGSIGVLVRAVERGDLDAATARETLSAMDEVGARLSASLLRRAERLIDDVAG